MSRTLVVVVLFALTGCKDLALPEVSSLAIEAPRDTVAPRQKLELTALSGAPPYVFSFAPNGKDSGELASISKEGLYQAGERGLTQDTVRVTDSVGSTADVLITVGAPLSLTPPLSVVAPGGRVRFVATGGLPPWTFSLEDGGVIADGEYEAAAPGDRVELITLTDATDDPDAVAFAQVSIGNVLVLFPGRSRVAPRERVGFVALGGQPPYTFTLGPGSSSGGATAPTIDAATGAYVAGSNDAAAQALDDVIVTDANGESAHAVVEVGPPLRVGALVQLAHPGVPLQLEASGGRPPYSFSFQPRGNRSRGFIDTIAGDYVPGPNTGAIDLVQVTDATGSVALAAPIFVGALQLEIPVGGTQLVTGDFDRDGAEDLALLNRNELVTVLSPARPSQVVRREALTPTTAVWARQLVPWDLEGDGRTDLYAPGNNANYTLRARFGGRFDLFEQDVGGLWGFARAGRIGENVFQWRRDTCAGIERVGMSSLARAAADGGFEPIVTDCRFPNTGNVFAIAANEGAQGPRWVSWFTLAPRPAGELSRSVLPMEMRYLDTSGVVTRSAQLPIPAGYRLTERARILPVGLTTNGLNMILDGDDQVGPNRMLVLLDELDAGVTRMWGIDTTAPSTAFISDVVPTPFPAAGMAGQVDQRGASHLVAWDTRTGRLPVFALEDAGVRLTQTLDVAYPVSAAGFADLNSDGERDLVTTSVYSSRADVFWSDGDGTFGRRPQFNVVNVLSALVADVDGDGVTDVLSGESNALTVLFGVSGQRQLAVGPRTPMLVNPDKLLVDHLDGDGRVDLFFRDDQGAMWVALAAGEQGAFAPPQPVLNPQGQQDVVITSDLMRADFGGAAPGVDVLTTGRDPVSTQVVALAIIRTSLATASRVFLPPPPGVSASACAYTSMQLDTGPEELIAACSNAMTVAYFVSRSAGSGANLTFSAWQMLLPPPTALPCGSFSITAPPGDARRFMACDDQLVVLTAAGGSVQFATHALPGYPGAAVFAALTPQSAEPDLVMADEFLSTVIVLSWNGTTWLERERVGIAGGFPLAPFTVTPNQPPDVLIGKSTELSFLTNDGGTLF